MKSSIISLLYIIPIKIRLKLYYYFKFKRKLNLSKPILYSEKIQKRKLDIRKEYSELSDKYAVRSFVSNKIGSKHLIKLLNVYDSINEVDFDSLPDKFVIKTNFGSGVEHIEIVDKKNNFSQGNIFKKFSNAMSKKYKGSLLGETQYNAIPPKIIIEEFIKSSDDGIDDFKFHIFNSKDGFLQIDFDRFKNHRRNLYDFSFNKLDYGLCYPTGEYKLPPLNKLEEMKDIAFKLSEGFDFVRVDLYLVGEKILFGEMTFTPGSGFEKFSDPNADKLYGSMWVQN